MYTYITYITHTHTHTHTHIYIYHIYIYHIYISIYINIYIYIINRLILLLYIKSRGTILRKTLDYVTVETLNNVL